LVLPLPGSNTLTGVVITVNLISCAYIFSDFVIYWSSSLAESEKNCILVIVGVDEYGKKEIVAIDDDLEKAKKVGKEYYLI